MTRKKRILITVLCLFTLISKGGAQEKNIKESDEIPFSATLSGVAFVTTDLEGSIQFYTKFLGFKEYKRIVINSPSGLAPFGLSGDKQLNYVALVPAVWSKENANFPGLNFVEIIDAKGNPFPQDGKRNPIAGEIIKAYSVKGLKKIEKLMKKASVPIVTPLLPSITGKSLTLTVIDPNGVRIQMYEYIKK